MTARRLRIHPEYYPKVNPCVNRDSSGGFQQIPAVFSGLTAYKCGMKGAVGTQLGLVQWVNFTAAGEVALPGYRYWVGQGRLVGTGWKVEEEIRMIRDTDTIRMK